MAAALLRSAETQASGKEVELFLKTYNTVSGAQYWTAATKLARMPMCLAGSALDFWNRKSLKPILYQISRYCSYRSFKHRVISN